MASVVPYDIDPYEADESFIEVIDLCTDRPRFLVKKESMGSEKQISVDPISLRESSNQQQVVMYPAKTRPALDVLIPLPPPKSKFLSQSLPNSVTSSPRFGSSMSKKKCKHRSQPSALSIMYRQDSLALANLERLREIHLQKSKSCGDGRASAPPEDFDLWLSKAEDGKHGENHSYNQNNIKYYKIEAEGHDYQKGEDTMESTDEKFKCKALCLYLPAFGKAKPVRARRQGSDMSQAKDSETGHVVSKRVSLEKFDCGSWNSSGLINDAEDDESDASNLFFDLPLELIRCSVNDTHSPVTTAFVFDKEPKGVLKNSTSKSAPRKSSESVRHVRFSTSSPRSHPTSPTSCITPRLLKARDDFNAFLEAQSA